jgi:hypothetical protein
MKLLIRLLREPLLHLLAIGADLLEPAAGELEAYLAANEQTFRRGPSLAFKQVNFGKTSAPETITPKVIDNDLWYNPAGSMGALL